MLSVLFFVFFVQIFGQRWSTVSEHMPGRLAKQCRERYLNNLDPELRRGAWSREVRALLTARSDFASALF